jgi:hypothetical protein
VGVRGGALVVVEVTVAMVLWIAPDVNLAHFPCHLRTNDHLQY